MSNNETNGDGFKDRSDFTLRQQTENINKLATRVEQIAENEGISRQATRDAINRLTMSNEAARDLANKAAQLTLPASYADYST